MAQSPNEKNIIEFDIALIKDGVGTTWIHENLKVGDKLEFSAPYGHFSSEFQTIARSCSLPAVQDFLARNP